MKALYGLALSMLLASAACAQTGPVGQKAPGQKTSAKESDVVQAAPENTESQELSVPDVFDRGMFALYEDNRKQSIPNLVTPDFLLLAYSQLRQDRIVVMEQDVIAPGLLALLTGLKSDLESSVGDNEAVVKDNLAYIRLLLALLNDDDRELSGAVAEEHSLVMTAGGVADSPLWGDQMDYSQFVPRGRYTASKEDAAFFRAVRYAGTRRFAFQPSAATAVSQEQALKNAASAADFAERLSKPPLKQLYDALIEPLSWQFGRSDDLTLEDLQQVMMSVDNVADTEFPAALVQYAKDHQRMPRILDGVVDVSKLAQGQSVAEVLIGWRLLPSRLSASGAAFQELVYQQGDTLALACQSCELPPDNASFILGRQVKGYPSYLELLAMLGSNLAVSQLNENDLLSYQNYEQQRVQAVEHLAQATGLEKLEQQMLQTIIRHSSTPPQESLATAAGFWVWQKYLALLYQKQPYTAVGKGIERPVVAARPGAWLVPSTPVYTALEKIAAENHRHDNHPGWLRFIDIVSQCVQISSRIELGLSPTAQQEAFLNEIDRKLLSLGIGADLPIVVDIHTNVADNQVAEAGIAFPVIRVTDKARGVAFQVREFKVPLEQRLDDQTWYQMLVQ